MYYRYFYVKKYIEVMAVNLEERLSKKQKQQLERMKSPRKKRAIMLSETKLSRKDVEELMGMNRTVYTRKHGAIRRK